MTWSSITIRFTGALAKRVNLQLTYAYITRIRFYFVEIFYLRLANCMQRHLAEEDKN